MSNTITIKKNSSRLHFKGRETELAQMDRMWAMDEATLLVLYGRRRVGKTRLLTHWSKQHPENTLYWVAEPTSAADQLKSFSKALFQYVNKDFMVPEGITFNTWEAALWQVAKIAEQQKFALLVDEFTYLLDADETIVGTLQKMWDQQLKDTNLFLALSGSHMGMMEKQVLSYQAPLYGRATMKLNLSPLPYGLAREFFPNYQPAERVGVYAVLGGIPAYWERFDPEIGLYDNIRDRLISNQLLLDEPIVLLTDWLDKPNNYVTILQAISKGKQTPVLIKNHTGMQKGHVSRYLSILQDTGYVGRRVPVDQDGEGGRKSRYYLTDPFLRFYYRFVSPNLSQIAMGGYEKAMNEIGGAFDRFIADNTWPELCREWLMRAAIYTELPGGVQIDDVGEMWSGDNNLPVVGINKATNEMVIGLPFWQEAPVSISQLEAANKEINNVLRKSDSFYKVYLVGFARSGYAPDVDAYVKAVENEHIRGSNWQARWCLLLDINEIDDDLHRLSKIVNIK
ncbi:MAG: ATP-binding protein [Chloroflexota bacterium]